MWLLTTALPQTQLFIQNHPFAGRDYLPWEQWNNLSWSQHASTGMICIHDSNICLALCGRIASRKVLLVSNWPNCCDKILQLSVCKGAGYMGGWKTRICSWPWFFSLTYTINSKETSQTLSVLLEAEGVQHLARQMGKKHNIYRILNRLYSCLWWIQPALNMQKSSTEHMQENTSNSGYLGPNFHKHLLKKTVHRENMDTIKIKCRSVKNSVSLAMILSWLEYFGHRSRKMTWVMESISLLWS